MPKRKSAVPTVEQMVKDQVSTVAARYWAPFTEKHAPFNASIIVELYQNELLGSAFSVRRIMLLEFSQYLERYLWPNYDVVKSPLEHVLSIIVMVNEKYRERVPAWDSFTSSPAKFPGFFRRVLEAALDEKALSTLERAQLITFLVHSFNSVEVDIVRTQIQKLISLPIWHNLLPSYRERLFKSNVKLRKYWAALQRHDAKMSDHEAKSAQFDRTFLVQLIERFFIILEALPVDKDVEPDRDCVRYCERFVELMIDLQSLLPTRRFFNAIVDSTHLITRCHLAPFTKRRPHGQLLDELLDMLKFYARFEINDLTGEALSEADNMTLHYKQVTALQRAAFTKYREQLSDFALLNVASVDSRKALLKHFASLTRETLYQVAEYLCLVRPLSEGQDIQSEYTKAMLLEMLVSRHERRPSQLQALNEMPLYPTEHVIWDENMVPYEHYSGQDCLALSKLNLQFLTLHDYLLRNFTLFRLESTYEIRQDLEDTLLRMKPWAHEDTSKTDCVFGGWARMGLPINTFSIVQVSKPNIGEKSPSSVRADIGLTLVGRPDVRHEWESLRKHDVCLLVSVRASAPVGTRYNPQQAFKQQLNIVCVRGCEIEGLLGPDGKLVEEFGSDGTKAADKQFKNNQRTYRVWLDTNQYREDMEATVNGAQDVYEQFNVLVRRNPKANNFKAVLDTIRQLMNTECVVPDWLHDLVLGYGDPKSAHYQNMSNRITTINFNDTFLNTEHLKQCFPDRQIQFEDAPETLDGKALRLTFPELDEAGNETADGEEREEGELAPIRVQAVLTQGRGPYQQHTPKTNCIRFTQTQVEAIKAGTQPGLTMVVGPPGTGKTDVAVQIISNIYHNWPEQRTLIVTHSNQALNQLFQKIIALDIDERHCLRLGHGEEALETEKDFSRYGRVNYVLAQRLKLLAEVERLQQALGVSGDVSYTCETAAHFYMYQVHARWQQFEKHIGQLSSAEQTSDQGESFEKDMSIAIGCWQFVQRMFEQLDEFRAFELLRTGRDRTEYLLVKEAKIIAMTCTHAALRRPDLVKLAFKYDNILMEESAQILEIETFIPLLLQNPQDGHNRLKRWIMIGDHHQLPPVIQNMAFQKYSNMEQSLFARFVRLGVPVVQLDKQGRARSSIASLYNWRYKGLGNLPHVDARQEFQRANAGLVYDYQLIDVGNFNGVGESTPSPYFYQNLAEAEYCVAMFMYLRLVGYGAQQISILTTYNGQKHLIRDIVERRCAQNPLIGRPHKVATVDKYQGQQNDIILLSLVRTNTVGHIRDVRRLIVALSRARLGLYVFGRVALFRNCFELTPAFNILCRRPLKLMLLPEEQVPCERMVGAEPPANALCIEHMQQMTQFVYDFYMQKVNILAQQAQQNNSTQVQPYEQPIETTEPISNEQVTKDSGIRAATDIEFESIEAEDGADQPEQAPGTGIEQTEKAAGTGTDT